MKIEKTIDIDTTKTDFAIYLSGPYFKFHSFSVEFINKQFQRDYEIRDIRVEEKDPMLRGRACVLVLNPQTEKTRNQNPENTEGFASENSSISINSVTQELLKNERTSILSPLGNLSENNPFPISSPLPKKALVTLYLKSYV